MTVAESNRYTRQAMKLPSSFNYDLLCRSIHLTRPQAHELMHYWRRRGWVSNIGVGQFQKTMIFGKTGNSRYSHLKPEIFPAIRRSRQDFLNARFLGLAAKHDSVHPFYKPAWADQLEALLVEISQLETRYPDSFSS